MSDQIARTVAQALAGGPAKGGRRWIVTGRNHRGEEFTTGLGLGRYRSYADAKAFADEIKAKGGTAQVSTQG